MQVNRVTLLPNNITIEAMQELKQSVGTLVTNFTEILDDSDLIAIVKERLAKPEPSFEVKLDDL